MEKLKIENKESYNIFNISNGPEFGNFFSHLDEQYFIKFNQKFEPIMNSCFITSPWLKSKKYIKIKIRSFDRKEYDLIFYQKDILKIEVSIQNSSPNFYSLYFHLNQPPSVFMRFTNFDELKNMLENRNNYSQNYQISLNQFETSQVNKNINPSDDDIREKSSYEKIKTNHKLSEFRSKGNFLNRLETLTFLQQMISDNDCNNSFQIDSILSQDNEFYNFFLLNLVMKISLGPFSNQNDLKMNFLQLFNLDTIKIIYNSKIISFDDIMDTNPRDSFQYELKKIKISKIQNNFNDITFYNIYYSFNFELQYAIFCLITYKKIKILHFPFDFLKILKKMNKNQQIFSARLLYEMTYDFNITESNLLEEFIYYFESNQNFIFEQQNSHDWEDNILLKTVEISPSLFKYKSPVYEKQNNFFRRFSEYKNNFLKINFVNEDGEIIYGSSKKLWEISFFQSQILIDGLVVGSRKYEFLGATNSQMKQASFWFFSIEGTRFTKVEQMINEMANFSQESNPYKITARRGQLFSTSNFIKILNPKEITVIPDIERNGYIFTDGVGKISSNLSQKICESLDIDYASAFQVRLAGAKGVLVVDPHISENDADFNVINVFNVFLRPSMIKFSSSDTQFSVIRGSSYSIGFLNRQIIILLSSLGIPDEIFISLMNNQISRLEKLFNIKSIKNIKSTEIRFVGDKSFYDFQSSGSLINEEKKKQIKYYIEQTYFLSPYTDFYFNFFYEKIPEIPFISSIVEHIHMAYKIDIKFKGKIMDESSCFLMGVIDEYGELEENQVFVQISFFENFLSDLDGDCKYKFYKNDLKKNHKNIMGDVYVTKNPCLHPGDIQILKAVYCDKLSHLENVIVFSSKGERPSQSKISGGDLDGDLYYVSWNKEIIANIKIKDFPSLNYSKPSNILKTENIQLEDIISCYNCFMRNNTVGLITNSHSALADKDILNIAFNQNCIKLSELFSQAIDAPKNGNFVSKDEYLKISGPILRPDFLSYDSCDDTYESPGILGKLFRAVQISIDYFDHIEFKYCILEDYYIDIKFELLYKFDKAYYIYCAYQKEIKNLMSNYKLSSEAEFFLMKDIHNPKNTKKMKDKKFDEFYVNLQMVRRKYEHMIYQIYETDVIDLKISYSIYIATYLNLKSIEEQDCQIIFKDFYKDMKKKMKIKIQYDLAKMKENLNSYREEDTNEIIPFKKIFSLPWIIKEVRNNLFDYLRPSSIKYFNKI